MGEPVVNGDVPSSQFLNHLASYPIISDSITTIKSHPYGQKSLELADQGYSHLAKPVIPYISKPYHNYLAPYVAKADSLGDSGLRVVESKFPIVKQETGEIRGTVVGYFTTPLKVAGEGKQHLFHTYGEEVKKCGGDGYVAKGKAVITTSLLMTSESLAWLGTWLGSKKEAVVEKTSEKEGSR
ncbi:hypothetical protein AJ80_07352 [Polytolypa hystricis UAMH7299]|uniref:CAP20 n=1 Tax=Polytolypa hystricis (strain UAMH7299) TaxID=1447883 RepID=A0A2B7XPK3_POLH7|nr:hypothetical protein AJ80_07352 [Polytolypa hystricis UAMH7299]